MAGTDIEISSYDGGSFTGYLAAPRAGDGPGIVVIQEIFGVNGVMRDLCDSYAAAGYVALCPDLFWRQEPGVQITDKTEEEWQKAFSLMQGFDIDTGIEDLKSTLARLRRIDGCTGRAGAVGYCLGGLLAYLMATRSDADASVGYYGVSIDQRLDEAAAITNPLMLHIAEEDEFVPREAQTAIAASLSAHPKVTLHSYPGVQHAFAREGGAHYDAASAKAANERTAAFFAKYLRA